MSKKIFMIKEIYKIAGGNTTLFVSGCPEPNRLDIAKNALIRVEQVGFISKDGPIPSLEMMGKELSINATLAFAKKLGNKGQLKTSGLSDEVGYYQEKGLTTIKVSLPYQTFPERLGTVVLFEGIGYLCSDKLLVPQESLIRDLWSKYNQKFNTPAFGLAIYRGNALEPYVYVRETDSLVPESACGSGSIAVSIVTGKRGIVQRTLERINILQRGNTFWVSASVRRVGKPLKEEVKSEQLTGELITV